MVSPDIVKINKT